MQTYKKRPDGGSAALKSSVVQAAESGNFNYQPTQADMGSRTDLPEAMRAKMEAAFGMDFSGVQLYQSQAVADAGANAMTMGNKIAFAPGKLDFSSHSGQALLGHELSHVASQARGEVSGQGFLDNSLLEARADREGAMAAAGESVYTGPVTPLSTTSTAMSAAGPMQAKKGDQLRDMRELEQYSQEGSADENFVPQPIEYRQAPLVHAPRAEREPGRVSKFFSGIGRGIRNRIDLMTGRARLRTIPEEMLEPEE